MAEHNLTAIVDEVEAELEREERGKLSDKVRWIKTQIDTHARNIQSLRNQLAAEEQKSDKAKQKLADIRDGKMAIADVLKLGDKQQQQSPQ